MRRELQRASDWLASNPLALVAIVAVIVVVPILLLGENSGSDMQQRLRAERLALGAQAASRGGEQIQTQLSLARQLLQNLGHKDALGAAVELKDTSGAKLEAGSVFDSSTDIAAVDVADVTGAVLITITGSSTFAGGTAAPAVKTVADRDYFRAALAGAAATLGVATQPLLLEVPVVISVPLSSSRSATGRST